MSMVVRIVVVSILVLSMLGGCDGPDRQKTKPIVFLIECQVDAPLPTWLDVDRLHNIEIELCNPFIEELIDVKGIHSVAWRIWESHFHVMIKAEEGVDAEVLRQTLSAKLASLAENGRLIRGNLFAREKYWISMSPLLMRLAERPRVDIDDAGSLRTVFMIDRQAALRYGLTFKDIRDQLEKQLVLQVMPGQVEARYDLEASQIGTIVIKYSNGLTIPLNQVATIKQFYTGVSRPWVSVRILNDRILRASQVTELQP